MLKFAPGTLYKFCLPNSFNASELKINLEYKTNNFYYVKIISGDHFVYIRELSESLDKTSVWFHLRSNKFIILSAYAYEFYKITLFKL